MKSSLRMALLACASFVGLALAAPALAEYKPSLTIEQSSYKLGAAVTADVFIGVPLKDDATAKLTIFSPAGYTANLTASPGTKIGTVVAVVKANQLAGAPLTLSGNVVVGNPADSTIVTAASQCTPGVTNDTVWVLNTTLQTQTINIPVFVRKVGPYVTQTVCFSPPQTAAFGAQLAAADFTIKGVFTNAAKKDGYEWSGIFTPYLSTGAPNPAGTVEYRTWVGLPQSLTFKRVKSSAGTVKFAGVLMIPGVSSADIRVDLYSSKKANPAPNTISAGTGKRVARTGKLKTNGKYTISRSKVKAKTYFQMRFQNYGIKCTGPSPSGLPVPCLGEDLAAMTSSQIKVLPPPKKKHK
jgi:hypothetical protein